MSDKETLIKEIRFWIAENYPQRVKEMGNLYHYRDVNQLIEGIKRILENHESQFKENSEAEKC